MGLYCVGGVNKLKKKFLAGSQNKSLEDFKDWEWEVKSGFKKDWLNFLTTPDEQTRSKRSKEINISFRTIKKRYCILTLDF